MTTTDAAPSLRHPIIAVGSFVAMYMGTLFVAGKVDYLGSRLAVAKSDAPKSTCHITEESGRLRVSSPACTDLDMQQASPGWAPRESQPTDPSFCTPTQPWFWFDLGGTMCVCDKQWDKSLYLRKVVSSFAFNFPHFIGPFQTYVLTQRWLWVFAQMMFNEVLEECILAVSGAWGYSGDPPLDMEPRYDSFIRDVVLYGLSGMFMGMVFVRVMKVPAFWHGPLESSWFAAGRSSKRHAVKVFFQLMMLTRLPGCFNTDFGKDKFYVQQVLLMFTNSFAIFVIYLMNRHGWPERCANNVHRFHVAWALFCACLWGFAVYPVVEEFYLMFIAIASLLVVLLVVWNLSRFSPRWSHILLGLPVEIATLSMDDYTAWVESEEGQQRQLLIDLHKQTFSKKQIQDALTTMTENGISLFALREMLLSSQAPRASMPFQSLEPDVSGHLDSRLLNFNESHRKQNLRLFSMCSVIMIICATAFAFWLGGEPFDYPGFMYGHHWCGLSPGSGCSQMQEFRDHAEF